MKISKNIESKLSIKILLLLFLLIIIITIIVTGMQLRRMEDISKKYLTEKATNISNQLDSIILRMEAVSTQILGSSTLQRMFVEANREEFRGKNYFDYHVEDKKIAQDILWTHRTYKENIDAINIFSNSTYVGMGYSLSTNKIIEISNRDCWKVPRNQSYKIMEDFQNQWGKNEKVISFVRPFIATTYRMQNIGTIEVQLDYQVIEDICELEDSELIVAVFSEKSIIYKGQQFSVSQIEQYKNMVQEKKTFQEVLHSSNQSVYTYSSLQNIDWTVMVLQDKNSFQKPFKNILLVAIMGSIFISLVVFLIVFGVVHKLTKPILLFAKDIEFSCDINEIPQLHPSDITEIAILQQNYIQFIKRIQESQNELLLAQETELQLRLQVLQEQVNPHFLFNSLSAISAVSIEENGKKVPIMCYQLSNLFRYSSNNEESVSMDKEMANVETYLQFMSWRYESNFSFRIEADGDLKSVTVAKMIFQPLVENCFTHGFKGVLPPYHLDIKCCVNDKGWEFRIIDNGCGVSNKRIEEITWKIETIREIILNTHKYDMLKTQNMALLNIYIRLLLQYREQLQFYIVGKSEMGGMKVNIIVKTS